jgi:hypothetical protein
MTMTAGAVQKPWVGSPRLSGGAVRHRHPLAARSPTALNLLWMLRAAAFAQ